MSGIKLTQVRDALLTTRTSPFNLLTEPARTGALRFEKLYLELDLAAIGVDRADEKARACA